MPISTTGGQARLKLYFQFHEIWPILQVWAAPEMAAQGETLMQATASISAGAYGDSLAAPSAYDGNAYAGQMERPEENETADGSCMKGILVALSIEAAAG